MALTARAGWEEQVRGRLSLPVKSAEVIFDGALVGLQVGGADDGRVVNWTDAVTTATITFLGVARVTAGGRESQDAAIESVTGNAGGTIEVEVDVSGVVLKSATVVALSAITHVGDLVYATDENTPTLTAPAGSTPVGFISRWITGTTGNVQLFSHGEARAFEGR